MKSIEKSEACEGEHDNVFLIVVVANGVHKGKTLEMPHALKFQEQTLHPAVQSRERDGHVAIVFPQELSDLPRVLAGQGDGGQPARLSVQEAGHGAVATGWYQPGCHGWRARRMREDGLGVKSC